jgi:putative hydrolase of the HAD superfamily
MQPSQPKATAIIFDLGGVVLRWNPDAILRNFYADETLRSAAKRDIFQHADWQDLDRGTLLEPEAFLRFHQRTGRPLEEMAALWQAARDSLQPIPQTLEILDELTDRNLPLYCLSNMPATTADYLRAKYSFWKSFRGIVISGEIKLLKPDPKIFAHIAERFGLAPQQTVFIDDHLPNVEGADRLGFKTVLFENPRQCRLALQERFGL